MAGPTASFAVAIGTVESPRLGMSSLPDELSKKNPLLPSEPGRKLSAKEGDDGRSGDRKSPNSVMEGDVDDIGFHLEFSMCAERYGVI